MSNTLDIKINDFENICRTCLSRENLKPLYEKCSQQMCFVEMLRCCTFLKFTKEDGLPVKICTNCIHELNQSFLFTKRCETTDAILRNCLITQFDTSTQSQTVKPIIEVKEEIKIEPEIILPVDHQPAEVLGNYEFVEVRKEEELLIENETYDDRAVVCYEEDFDEDLKETDSNHSSAKSKRRSTNSQIDEQSSKNKDGFTERADLLKDRQRINSEEEKANSTQDFQCTECKRAFESNKLLRQHYLIHGEKKFLCNICRRSFASECIFNSHAKCHQTRPYVCQVCEKAFSNLSALKSHKQEKSHVCSICNKAFTLIAHLKHHVRIHSEIKPYTCEVCNTAFTQRISLNKHLRIHIGEYPYNCAVCSKPFTLPTNFKQHMRIHNGEKPYFCEICNGAFTLSSGLKRHMILHTGEKPFPCEVCGQSFSSKRGLTSHKRVCSQ